MTPKAIAVTLKNHPEVNASYAQDAISYNSDINVAVAVAMPDGGLITPVLGLTQVQSARQ